MKNNPKVFLYGTNCASVLNSLTVGFKKNNVPVKSVSFDFNRSVYNNYSDIKCICSDNHPGRIKLYFYKLKGLIILVRYLIWCDIVHIYGTKRRLHYWLVSQLAKSKFVTFVGSDIRVPETELALNPFFKYAYYNDDYEYKDESKNNTDALVRYLADLNYGFIVWDTGIFINQKITSKVGVVPHASENMLGENTVQKLPGGEKKVLIIHSPTAPVAKGTEYVLKAIEKLKNKDIPFEFKLLQNLPNEEYILVMEEADIFVDQLIWGGYGIAAQQALQMGKVVVTYMTPERLKIYGDGLPVQNADINNLADVLENLIVNKDLREQISGKSILYYKKMHRPEIVARRMLATYELLSDM